MYRIGIGTAASTQTFTSDLVPLVMWFDMVRQEQIRNGRYCQLPAVTPGKAHQMEVADTIFIYKLSLT